MRPVWIVGGFALAAAMGCGPSVPAGSAVASGADAPAEEAQPEEAVPAGPSVAELEAMLSVDDGEWNLVGYEAQQLPHSAVGPLLELLEHDEARVRRRAVHCLGWVGDPRAVEPLRGLLADPDLRQDAVLSLAELGDAAIPALGEALASKDPETRRLAVRALSDIGSDATVGPLIEALADSYDAVAAGARAVLAKKACQDLGPEPGPWKAWWKDEAHRFDACED